MHCRECGQMNPPENRYCGMCGCRLDVASAAGPARREEPLKHAPQNEGISGPSFLGLNYLLEDEPPRRWRNYVLLLILLVVGGLIWMQWRTALKAQIARISALATQPAQPAPPPSPPEPDVSVTDQSAPLAGTGQQQKPETESSTELTAAASGEPTAQAGPDQEGQSGKESKSAKQGADTAAAGEQTRAPDKQSAAAPKADVGSEQKENTARPDTASGDTETSPAHARPVTAVEDDSMLVLAQKYLHGRGVQQDCEQGLIYLRRAAQHSSAKARSQFGALYATGHCVPEDRVEAYRWFTAALELDPNNVWLERQRDSLFAQMTSQERQRAQ